MRPRRLRDDDRATRSRAGVARCRTGIDAPPNVRALSRCGAAAEPRRLRSASISRSHVGDDAARSTANRATACGTRPHLPEEPLWLEQVHGIDVVEHDGTRCRRAPPRADAAVAFEPGRVCVVMTADCLPVVFVGSCGHARRRRARGLARTRRRRARSDGRGAAMRTGGAASRGSAPRSRQPAFEVGRRSARSVRRAKTRRTPRRSSPNPAGRYQADLYELSRAALRACRRQRASAVAVRCTQRRAGRVLFVSARRRAHRPHGDARLARLTPLPARRSRTWRLHPARRGRATRG